MLLLYKILKWINIKTAECIEKLNRKIELRKIYKKIKDNKDKFIEVNGEKGYVLLIEYETKESNILQTIKNILIVPENSSHTETDTNKNAANTNFIENENGFVIKEIKFDDYFKKEDLYNVINNQIKEFNNANSSKGNQKQYNKIDDQEQFTNMLRYNKNIIKR